MDILNLMKNKLVKSSGMVLAGIMLSSFFMFLFRILLARSLTPAEYGLFFSINSLLIIVGVFANFGLAEAYIKYFSEYRNNPGKLKGLIYLIFLTRAALSIILLILCFFLSDFLTTHFFKSGDGRLLFNLLVLATMLTSATYNFMLVTYRAMNNMKLWSMICFLNSFMLLLITAVGFLFWKNILVAAIASSAGSFLIFCYFCFRLKKDFKELDNVKADMSFREWKMLSVFGTHIILIAICNYILNSTDTLMLTYFSTLESVGLYQVAVPVARVFLMFTTAINTPLLPYLSGLYAKDKKQEFRSTLYKINKLCVIFLLPVAIMGALASKYILWIFFGEQYIPAAHSASVLFISMFCMLIFNINLNGFIASGNPKLGHRIIIVGAVLNIILNYFFILRWDYLGASIATLISCAVMAAYSTYHTFCGNPP